MEDIAMESSATGSPEPNDLNAFFAQARKPRPRTRRYALGLGRAVARPSQLRDARTKAINGLATAPGRWWAGVHYFGGTEADEFTPPDPGEAYLLLARRDDDGRATMRIVDSPLFTVLSYGDWYEQPFDPGWFLNAVMDEKARVVYETQIDGGVQ